MSNPRAQSKRSPFAVPVVIGLLNDEPQHGYALFARIHGDLGDVWQVGMNRLYALLDEMEADGLIKGRAEREGARPARRVFNPTAKGRRRFERWLHEPSARMNDMRVNFPPRLYFAQRRGAQDVVELIQAQRIACRGELERMTARRSTATADAFRAAIFDLRVRQITSILDWLDDCEARFVMQTTREARRNAA